MTYLRKFLKSIVLFSCVLASMLAFASAKPLVTRHIYVHLFSGKWIIQFSGDASVDGCGQGPCVMTDNAVIHYGDSEGSVKITDPQNISKEFKFGYCTGGKSCPGYIQHDDGRTGNVFLNEPVAGDIVINGSTWGY